MKTCPKCNTTKPLAEFHKRSDSPDGRQSWCKPCNRAQRNKSYRRNPAKQKMYEQARRRKQMRLIKRYASRVGCVDCDETDFLVLQFDHRDQDTKHFCISEGVSLGRKRLKEEIRKCDVRCANCHTRRTAIQLGYHKQFE